MLHRLIKPFFGAFFTLCILVSTLAIAAPAFATGVYQMPPLSDSTWIVDDAGLISRINESKITEQLQDLAEMTGNEVRFVTIHRLDYGETPATFADALMAKWFPESESRANQSILVLDDVTNGAALKVGDAAAEMLSADIATSVVDETIAIPLRQGNKYNQALLTASDRLVAVLSGETDPGPPAEVTSFEMESTFASAEETEENRGNYTWIVVGFLVAATVIPMATYYIYLAIGG
ncbi:photosystem II repair protein Psb32 [Halomicronema sp. CCY15110]|uniref:photosystem II repair protein Psb32 n=1 Tax=Halomicronema sp. CCY15110 TaxID=2767773 RepID=UPI00195049CC|nr:TPM domain-containing protein [Halomicronema sp. CCY15110]